MIIYEGEKVVAKLTQTQINEKCIIYIYIYLSIKKLEKKEKKKK